jgi:predicted transcriptional regulator
MTMRTRTGIAKDADIPSGHISTILEQLIGKDVIERTQSNRNGNLRFRITAKGIGALRSI